MTVAPAADPVSPVASIRTATRRWSAPSDSWLRAEHVAVALVWLWWVFPLTHGFGGRDAGVLAIALLTAIPALLLTRPWRRPIACAVAAAVGSAALVVCALSPTGWYGANVAAGYVYAAALFAIGLGYARTPARRTAVAVAIAVAGLEQFRAALTPWMGSGDPAHPMVGTFYWHNPYAAYLLAPALVGLALAVTATTTWLRVVGSVVAPLGVAGVVFSSSRATTAALAVGAVLLAVAAARGGRLAMKRFVAVGGVCVVVVLALPGPPFFDNWQPPTQGASERAAEGESLSQNGGYRTQFWREAAAVAREHPVTGGGFHSLGTASGYTSPPGWARSTLAHNGYLQAVSDGGLVLAVPFLGGCLLAGAAALRALYRSRLRLEAGSAVTVAAALGTLALLAHSAVDFDWSYPALFAMTGLVAALALGPAPESSWIRRPRLAVAPAVVLAVVVLVAAGATRSWSAADRISHNGVAAAGVSDTRLLNQADRLFGSYQPAAAVLRRADQGRRVDPTLLRLAWQRTADAARVDPGLAAFRARALVLLGEPDQAVAAVRDLLAELGPTRYGGVAADAAVTLALAGHPSEARALLGPVLVRALAPGSDLAHAWQDVRAADKAGLLADPATRACVLTAARILGPPPVGLDLLTGVVPAPPGDCASRLKALAG